MQAARVRVQLWTRVTSSAGADMLPLFAHVFAESVWPRLCCTIGGPSPTSLAAAAEVGLSQSNE
eukprot:1161472-Pelagomonas_calceolata.AAC.8